MGFIFGLSCFAIACTEDAQEPCLFINGRFIGPCPQLNQTSPSPDTTDTPTSEPEKGMESPEMTDSPSPDPDNGMENPTNITGVLAECKFNGSLVAPLAAIEACMVVDQDCNPQVVVPFSGGNETLPAILVNKIVEQACRTEAIASCSQTAFSTVPPECKDILEMGPPTPNDVCPDVRAANEIFESSVSLYCEQEFTPPEEGN
ncbi:unnamed protein product [Ostreobium quekettii]|uniref:Uncharacterized protein n=1 Tax=Ostreobium quekettii TaxID=121088 RepID=A0A8S1IVC8_9CHLO|nr:unnamed protein product [Ostreobium quekettii]